MNACDLSQEQMFLAGGTAIATLLVEAAIGHLALKKRVPAASVLGLLILGGVMLVFWWKQKTNKEKQP